VCIDLHQTRSVGEGSDRLQLIKFWLFCAPEKGVYSGAKKFLRLTTTSAVSVRLYGGLWRGENFVSTLLQPVRSVCFSLSTFFIVIVTFNVKKY